MVYGFKGVKGLEFEDVAIVDFFSSGKISSEQQKSWKYLLGKDGAAPRGYPAAELEMQMKVLYTSITRARAKLVFIERKFVPAGKYHPLCMPTMVFNEMTYWDKSSRRKSIRGDVYMQ